MDTSIARFSKGLVSVAVAVLLAGSLVVDSDSGSAGASFTVIPAAQAAGGSGKGGQPDGTGHPDDKGQVGGGGQSGGKGIEDRVLREPPDQAGGQGGEGGPDTSSSGVILGRLSMARAYASPNFDPSRVDDPEAPLANLEAYRTILLDGMVYPPVGDPYAVQPTLENLATYLAKVATAPIAGDAIAAVNEYLDQYLDGGVSDAFAATGIDADALADRINELVGEGHEE